MNSNKPKSWGEEIWEEKAEIQKEVGVIKGVIGSERDINQLTKGMMDMIDSEFPYIMKTGKMLDAGVGPMARFSIEFCKRGFDVVGVDISDTTLKFAQEYIDKSGCKNIKLIKDDLVELKKIKEKFDLVFCSGTFGHIPSFLAVDALQSFNRVLKEEGFCLFDLWIKRDKTLSDIIHDFVYNTARWIKKRFKIKTFDVNCSFYTVEEIEEMIKRAGFEISNIVGNFYLLKKIRSIKP